MQSIRLDLELSGSGGHSARPYEAPDLLWVASRIIQDGYQMVYRKVDLRDSQVILTFTEINAKQGYNVIPNKLSLTGTVRLSDPKKKTIFLNLFKQYLSHLEKETGAKIVLKIIEGSPPIHNNPLLMAQLRENMDILSKQKYFNLPINITTNYRTPGGDDFSHYSKAVPGAMIRFGTKTEPGTFTKHPTAGLHDGLFDVPKPAIKKALLFFIGQLLQLDLGLIKQKPGK